MMMKRRWIVALLLVFAILCSGSVVADEASDTDRDRIILRSNYMRYMRDEGYYLARDDVEILHLDYILTGDEAEVYDYEVLYITGNVIVYRGDDVLKGDYLIYYYDEEHMIMDSTFDLLQEREVEKDDGSIEIENLHMVGEYLEIIGQEDRIYARDSIHMVYRDFRVWSDELDFFEALDELFLFGNVTVIEKDETVRAEEVRMLLAENVFEALRGVEAEVIIRRPRPEEQEVEEVEEIEEIEDEEDNNE